MEIQAIPVNFCYMIILDLIKLEAFFCYSRNSKWPPFVYIEKKKKNARMINDTTFLTYLGSRNPMNMIFLRSEVKVTF